jgi:octanoyl-[GcvH]:protein N-octanoyltransferase
VPTTATEATLILLRNQLTGDGPLDTATSRAILQRVTNGDQPETLEVGTPHRVAAFGKHDTLTGGFRDAVRIAASHGYDPTIRIAGGRAVVFAPTIVRFAWTMPAPDAAATMHRRFAQLADAVVRTLARFGIASGVGEVPDEYCAGQYSVNVLGTRKVMGVGQRLTRSAAQVGGMIVVSDPDMVNAVLVPVYDALGVPMDPAATGALSDVSDVSTDDVMDVLAAEIADGRPTLPGTPDEETRTLAASLRPDHQPPGFAA